MPTFDDLYGARLNVELNNSDSNQLYTSTRRQQAINDGLAEFASLTECYVRRATLTISCNTAEYNLSTLTDYTRMAVHGLPEYRLTSSGSSGTTTVLAGDDFPQREELWNNREASGWQSTTPRTPTGWYLRPDGGRLWFGLDARPRIGSSETAVVRVPYVARPAALTSSTDVPFTDTTGTRVDLTDYHQAAVHYAASRLLPLIGDYEGSQTQFQRFLGYVTRFLQFSRPKGGQRVTFGRNYLQEARRGRTSGDVPTAPNYW